MQDIKDLTALTLPELRFRRSYIKERLAELKLERERLVVERDRVKDELQSRDIGTTSPPDDKTARDVIDGGDEDA